MLRLMADNDVVGHVDRLGFLCQTPQWVEFWRYLGCVVCSFENLGLAADASDAEIWRACQANQVILITGNRSAKSPDSLDATIHEENDAHCLPVLTLSNRDRVLHDREYAEAVVERLLEVLLEVEQLRGTGRLFLP